MNVHRRHDRGLTLVEVLVTTAVLSVGLTAVFGSFLRSLGYSQYVRERLAVSQELSTLMWQAEQSFLSGQEKEAVESHGTCQIDRRHYSWSIQWEPLQGGYLMHADMQRMDTDKAVLFSRTGYVYR